MSASKLAIPVFVFCFVRLFVVFVLFCFVFVLFFLVVKEKGKHATDIERRSQTPTLFFYQHGALIEVIGFSQ